MQDGRLGLYGEVDADVAIALYIYLVRLYLGDGQQVRTASYTVE